MSSGVGIVAASEVPVVRRDDGVRFALLNIFTIPLAYVSSSVSTKLVPSD